jgi:hypothetical protein
MISLGELLDKDDPRRFVWLGRAAATANGGSVTFWDEMSDQMRNFNSGTGHANVVFVIGRAFKGHINNEKRTIFGSDHNFSAYIGLAHSFLRISVAIISKSSRHMDNYWAEKQSCERYSKDDWEDDLGCERRSSIFGKETIGRRYSRTK